MTLGFDDVLVNERWIRVARVCDGVIDSASGQAKLFVLAGSPSEALSLASAVSYGSSTSFRWRATVSNLPGSGANTRLNDIDIAALQTYESQFSSEDVSTGPSFTEVSRLVDFMTGDGKVDVTVITSGRLLSSVFASICSLRKGGCMIIEVGPIRNDVRDEIETMTKGLFKVEHASGDMIVFKDFRGLTDEDKALVKTIALHLFHEGAASLYPVSHSQVVKQTSTSDAQIEVNESYIPLLKSRVLCQPPKDLSTLRDAAIEFLSEDKPRNPFPISERPAFSATFKLDALTQSATNALYARKFRSTEPIADSPPTRDPSITAQRRSMIVPELDEMSRSVFIQPDMFWDYVKAEPGIWSRIGRSQKLTGDFALMPLLDVLVNSLKINPLLKYERIFVHPGLLPILSDRHPDNSPIRQLCVQDTSQKVGLVVASQFEDLLGRVQDQGDILVKLDTGLISSDSTAQKIFRLSQISRQISICKSSLDESLYVFAQSVDIGKAKKFRVHFTKGEPIRALIWDPSFRSFIKGFNERVMRDTIISSNNHATQHQPRDLQSLTLQLDSELWKVANNLGLKAFLTNKRTRVGVYFGTFDPIHENHVALIQFALSIHSDLKIDQVVVVPNYEGNDSKKDASSVEDRLRMCHLRASDSGVFSVREATEDTRPWESKSRIAQKITEEISIDSVGVAVLILGEDSFVKAVTSAKNKKQGIFKGDCEMLVFPRSTEAIKIPNELSKRVKVVSEYRDPIDGLSSTKIRELLSAGQVPPSIWLHPNVAEYVLEKQLYSKERVNEEHDDEDGILFDI